MGNASAKEERRPSAAFPRTLSGGRSGSSSTPSPSSPFNQYSNEAALMHADRARTRDIAHMFGLPPGGGGDRDVASLERRRESKAEREAKKIERERLARERERERSMREESVDGGYLVTQGVYTGVEDFSKPIVRQLMIERRLAPFWPGLNDHNDSWTEHQLVAAARNQPIPAADEVPATPASLERTQDAAHDKLSEEAVKSLTVPIGARSQTSPSETSLLSTSSPVAGMSVSASPPAPSSGSLLRGRAKTMATLTTPSRSMPASELQPREMHLPKDPNVNGQPIEAYLYRDASECPICFLYYPPHLNRTRCCDQPICSECFVQIKRPDPHPPEHPDPNDPQHANEQAQEHDGQLVSEPSQCPYCAQPEFGVTYEPLAFRRGLTYVNHPGVAAPSSAAMSSSSSLASTQAAAGGGTATLPLGGRRRATSLAANAPGVISTDTVRPDWANKLASARAQQARRAAAATALHTAAYMMNGRSGGPDRPFPGFGRRVMMRRATGESSTQSHPAMQAYVDRYGRAPDGNESSPTDSREEIDSQPSMLGPPRGSSRRNRVEDLEEMMMMEAIRLSLVSEEERRRKEEKEAKKEAKKKAKEDKKAEKAARKAGVYGSSANPSSSTLASPSSASLSLDHGVAGSRNASISGKGKSVARDRALSDPEAPGASASTTAGGGRAQLKPEPAAAAGAGTASTPFRPSHLRTLSNVSSSDASSLADADETNTPGGSAGLEPLFNFRSLAAMIGEADDNDASNAHDAKGADDENENEDYEDALAHSVTTLTPENVRVAEALRALGGDDNETETETGHEGV